MAWTPWEVHGCHGRGYRCVDGDITAFAEDRWRRVSVGDLALRFGELCDRCVVPTIDPVTLTNPREESSRTFR